MELPEDEIDESSFPPSPSPAPRIRPNGPRGILKSRTAIPTAATGSEKRRGVSFNNHKREISNSSSILSYEGIATTAGAAALSIRPVTDKSLKVVNAHKSLYPTKPSQFLHPAGASNLLQSTVQYTSSISVSASASALLSSSSSGSDGQRKVDVVVGEDNSSGNQKVPGRLIIPPKEDQRITTTTNKNNVPAPTYNSLTTSDTFLVRSKNAFFNNNASPPPVYVSPSFPSHNEPRLVPLSAPSSQTSQSSYETTPPGEVVRLNNHYYDFYSFRNSTSPSTYSSGIDVDRLAMVEGDNNANNNHMGGVPPFLTPSEQQWKQNQAVGSGSLSPSLLKSRTLPPPNNSLKAIAGVAPGSQFDSTPLSTTGSVDSSDTVIKQKGYTGSIPPGYYSLFPPVSSPPSVNTRYVAGFGQTKRNRSSSAPRRPVSGGPLSPMSAGTNSPVSPVSPDNDDDSLYASSRPRTRSGSDSLWNTSNVKTPMVLVPGRDSARLSQYTISNQIPRKPVAGSNTTKYNSFISTITSESESDTRGGSGQRLKDRIRGNTAGAAKDLGSGDNYRAKERYRRSSSALPHRSFEADESQFPGTSATIDFSHIDTDFPLTEPIGDLTPPRQHITSLIGKRRLTSEAGAAADYSSLASGKQSNAVISPSSISSKAEYRDSQCQTDTRIRTGETGASSRDGLPAWARYTSNSPNRQLKFRESTPGPQSPSQFDPSNTVTCPNCQARWPPEIFSNLFNSKSNLLSSEFNSQPKAVKFDASGDRLTNESQRLYYSNEGKHREILGRVLIATPTGRRHTVGSANGHIDSLSLARNRETTTTTRSRTPHTRPVSDPDRSVFQGEDIRDSPHLRHGRADALKRRTVFQAPSLDEGVEGVGWTRRNIQIWCFVIGFVFPLGMF